MAPVYDVPLHCRAALSVLEAASYSGIGEQTLRRQIFLTQHKQGDFPFFMIGDTYKIPRLPLDEWIKRLGEQHAKLHKETPLKEETGEAKPKTGRKRMSVREKIKSLG